MGIRIDPSLLQYEGGPELDARLSKAMLPPLDLLVSQWADSSRVLSKKHAKEHGDWNTDRVPHAREIMDCFSARSRVQRVAFMKGAQVAGTESGNNVVGYHISSAPAPMLFVSPTLIVTKRTSARIQAMVDDDPDGLGQLILPARQREAKNSQFEKHFPGGALYFATANSASNLRSTAAKILIFDEVDAYPNDVGGEGGVIDVAEARAFTFGDGAKSFLISTPGVDQTSIIKREYLKGDQRLWMMPCPHCNRRIDFHWGQFAWDEGKPATVVYKCEHCQKPIIEGRHKSKMLARGRWIPKALRESPVAMKRMEAGDWSELEAFNEESVNRSYKLPGFYSPVGWLSWAKIIRLWEEAQGDPTKLKAVTNTHFGETWVEQGEAPAWEAVYGRRTGSYVQRQVPRGVVFLTAGADVGQDHVEISVWGWGKRRQRWLIEHIRIDGLKDDPETWEQVSAAVQRRYLHPTGAVLAIRRFLIDRNYHPEVVDPWVESQDRTVVFALRGSDTLDIPVKRSSRKEKGKGGEWGQGQRFDYLTVGVSVLKLELYGCLNTKLVEGRDYPPGWIWLPGDITTDWSKQLVSERLEYGKTKGGRRKGKWVTIGSARQEALDTAVYARAGAFLVGWDRWSDHDWAREEATLQRAGKALAIEQDLKRREAGARVDTAGPVPSGIEGLMLAEAGALPVEPEPEETEVPVEIRDGDDEVPAKAAAPEQDPNYAGVRKTWGNRGRGATPWSSQGSQAGVVGARSGWRASAMAKSTASEDDD